MNQIRGRVCSAIIGTSHLLLLLLHRLLLLLLLAPTDEQRQLGPQLHNLAPITHERQSWMRDRRSARTHRHTHTQACVRTHTQAHSIRKFTQLITSVHNISYLEDTEPSLSVCGSMYVNLSNNVCTNGLLPCVSWFALISLPEGDGVWCGGVDVGRGRGTGAVCSSYVPSGTVITSQLVSIKATLT